MVFNYRNVTENQKMTAQKSPLIRGFFFARINPPSFPVKGD